MTEQVKDVNTVPESTEHIDSETTETESIEVTPDVKKTPDSIPYDRFREVNAKAKELEAELNKLKSREETVVKPAETQSDWHDKVEFRQDNPNYSREEVDLIAKFKQPGQSFYDAAKNPQVTEFIDFRREKERKEEQVQKPSSASSVSTPPKPVKEMTTEEFYAWAKENDQNL